MHVTGLTTGRRHEKRPSTGGSAPTPARRVLERAADALFAKQHHDGHWCAELEGDSILGSEYLLMKAALGQDEGPSATREDLRRFPLILEHLRRLQRADGTWGQYPGSPPDLSATVKAYFALKLFGESADAPHMRRARDAALALGGADRINTFSMFYLACLGQVSWDACPVIPPEVVLLPRASPFHLSKVSAWTRTMIVPLAVCTALRPVRTLPRERGIDELFIDPAARARLHRSHDGRDPISWNKVFLWIDGAIKALQQARLTPGRGRALRECERWLLQRVDPRTTDGLGAIFPPMVYIQIALKAMGYERDHPVIRRCEHELDRFLVEADDHIRIQPCFSPVWDTGIALYALTECGRTIENDDRIARTALWLCDREVQLVGDWAHNLRPGDRAELLHSGAERVWGAWAFEYRNDWYPDVDDTAMVCKALWRASAGSSPDSGAARQAREAALRGIRWILAMQNDDGGWAAFDRTTHRAWMEHVPFADHNAMQDPSCADITGRTIEALITCGVPRTHAAVRRAVDFLLREQRREGCWWGRWGVNFLYGTWQAVGGLTAAGEDPRSGHLRRAADWLLSMQNEDGGFGESANSYLEDRPAPPDRARAPSTASQTSWAMCALMFLRGARDPAVERAAAYLINTQLDADSPADPPTFLHDEPAGSWREPWFTGTGFPKVFYLRYHLYRHYFPVMALGRYCRLRGE